MRKISLLLIAASALTLASPALAHRQWLLPQATTFSGANDWVSVDAAVSNDLFFADHFPMRVDTIKVWAPDGSPGEIANGALGHYRSTFDVKLDKPGTWKIGTASSGFSGSFKDDGVEWRVGGRGGPPGAGGPGAAATGPKPTPTSAPANAPAPGQPGAPRPSVPTVADIPANATDVVLTESSSRNEIFVTAGAPTTTVLKPSGKGLEMSPVTHPDELVANEEARFIFLVDGKPAANLKVTLVPGGKRFRDTEGAFEVTTGKDGVAAIKWPAAGMYWLNASATDARTTTPRATQRRMSYTSTLEVSAP
ncbi:MAG: nickel uptake transporter family protein [Sphingomonadales bacterium]|nr:nickel uptake transporter family protein [Sphingomonadales bacterium]